MKASGTECGFETLSAGISVFSAWDPEDFVRDDSYGPNWLTKASQHEDGYEGGGRGLKDQWIQPKIQEATISAMPLCPIFHVFGDG